MQRGQARTFDEHELSKLLDKVVANTPQPEVMRTAFMLSFYAGLRVQEIAGLSWKLNVFNAETQFHVSPTPVFDQFGQAVKDANGTVMMRDMPVLRINKDIGKYGRPRNIPLHPDLAAALRSLHGMGLSDDWVIPSGKNGAEQDLKHRAHALKMRINRIYKAMGLAEASTHSGRRSFITRAARRAEAYGNSIVDVRDLAGHASINTTQHYVDPSPRQGDLVNAVWR